MTKHAHEHDEYVSGVRAELLGDDWADAPDPADHEHVMCPFCGALEEADRKAGRRTDRKPRR
ncbi:hypothetical protein [Streptomyces sp. NPDC048338]|uniref:hypothetical protein n=1 Tax=Streptomyces sp. NPDC048338 TaxID=3365536 RepID=UPI003723684C